MSTTVQYEVLFYEKPVLLLGSSYLEGHNIGYCIYDEKDLPDVLDQALERISFDEKL